MSLTRHDQGEIRKYLLGLLSDDAQQEIEKRLLGDDDVFEELMVAEDELIDDYLKGFLPETDRLRFETYFLAAPERLEKLRFGRAFRRLLSSHVLNSTKGVAMPPLGWRFKQIFASPSLRTTVVALVLIGLIFGLWRLFLQQSDVSKGLVALNSAYVQGRPIEARISELEYAPFSTTRGDQSGTVNYTSRDRAERLLLDAVAEDPTPTAHHALGLLYLTKREFDEAIGQFEEALKASPNNAQIYADLGAALLEKGKVDNAGTEPGKGLEELGRSLQMLNKALELNGSLPEAIFNRALCLQEQSLWQQAEAAWTEYLNHDSTSPWADEAKRKVSELQQRRRQISQDDGQLLNEFMAAYETQDDAAAWKLISERYGSDGSTIANQLLFSFLHSQQLKDGIPAPLQALTYLAELEFHFAGDSYHLDVVRFYRSLPAERRRPLAVAHQQMEQAYEQFKKSQSHEAISLYTTAKQEFERQGDSAEALFAEYRIAHCYVVQPNMEKSREIFAQLLSQARSEQYRWLTGQSLLSLANISFNSSRYSEAIAYSKQALALFRDTGYTDGLLRVLKQLADEHSAVNKRTESLTFLQQAIVLTAHHFSDPLQQWGIYTTVAFNFDALDLLSTAAAYQLEALAIAQTLQRPLIASRSYSYLGATYGKLNNYEQAIKNLQQAYEMGKSLADDPNGVDMMGSSSLQIGDFYRRAGYPAKALEFYDSCIHLYDQLGFQYYAYAAHRGKLLTYLDVEDDLSAEGELRIILPALEEYRSNIKDESQRNSFFDVQQNIYDAAITFAYSRKHDPQTAFRYSEMSRARSLLDALQKRNQIEGVKSTISVASVTLPLVLSDLQRQMPEDAQLLQYSVLDKKLIIWLIRKEDFLSRETEIDAQALAELVRRYLKSITFPPAANAMEPPPEARRLYEILIRPVESSLDKHRLLCVVPDKILSLLPFGALISSESGRYLVQDYRVELAPSATIFIASTLAAAKKTRVDQEKLLSVGDPSFDKTLFPGLSGLPSAAREAQTISTYYKSAQLLLNENACEKQITDQMVKSDVVHLAVHYVVDQRTEMLSELVFAKERQSHRGGTRADGVLHAYEIYDIRLPQTRLAVLSACKTGIELSYQGEGAISIARPFMVAGVPLVVASLWPVDSESTAELMIRLHKHRKLDGFSTIEALRQAQLDLLTDRDSPYRLPYYWAPFIAVGGSAPF